jgi:hypothetical protein
MAHSVVSGRNALIFSLSFTILSQTATLAVHMPKPSSHTNYCGNIVDATLLQRLYSVLSKIHNRRLNVTRNGLIMLC